MDIEDVIERLHKVSYYFKSMLMAGYDGDADIYREHRESVKMAISILKEQVKTKVVFHECNGDCETVCGNCGHGLDKTYSRCPKCQKELDWNALQT